MVSPSPNAAPLRAPAVPVAGAPNARSSAAFNATRHGILSTNPVIPGLEQRTGWDDHLVGQIAALKPHSDLELVLAHRIARTLWRLNRLIGFECHALRPSDRYLCEYRALVQGLNGTEARLDRDFRRPSILRNADSENAAKIGNRREF